MRVATILARHGAEKYHDAEQQVDAIFARQMPAVQRRTIVVDNALPPDFRELHDVSKVLIGGDNSSWEFSAWKKGLSFLGEEIWSYDLIHLATSAFRTLYIEYLDRFSEEMLRAVAGKPVCLGHIDCYNDPVRIFSFQSQHWVRTSFLFAAPCELKMLKNVVSINDSARFFGSGPHEPFAADAPLSKNYQKYILDWLAGADIGQGSLWHSRLEQHPDSWPLFRAKATAIFNEHLLAIRLRAQSSRLVDATWLSTQLKTRTADAIDWNRGWRNQLAERDTGKVRVG